jgi:hypothetical protein
LFDVIVVVEQCVLQVGSGQVRILGALDCGTGATAACQLWVHSLHTRVIHYNPILSTRFVRRPSEEAKTYRRRARRETAARPPRDQSPQVPRLHKTPARVG